MTRSRFRRSVFIAATFVLWCCHARILLRAQTPADRSGMTGQQLYQAACVACHAPDGKGQPHSVVGFDQPLPDFTDCAVVTPEPSADWQAVVHMGGSIRALSHIMPSFTDALTEDEIARIVAYIQQFCADPAWPRGDLNFPRALFTEKAYPENETIFTVTTVSSHPHAIESRIDYEHRIGKRAQYEVGIPFDLQQGGNGAWSRGLGDVNVAYRQTFFDSWAHGSIAAAGGEITLPTGKEAEGLGGGVTVLEAYGMFDQALPRNGFVQFHAGVERPTNTRRASSEVYWRGALGTTYMQGTWGRSWSPMIEVLGAKELEAGAGPEWDVVPQMQVSLSGLQHVLLNAGVRVPVNQRQRRSSALMVYLLWDWFDGGFFSFWRAP